MYQQFCNIAYQLIAYADSTWTLSQGAVGRAIRHQLFCSPSRKKVEKISTPAEI